MKKEIELKETKENRIEKDKNLRIYHLVAGIIIGAGSIMPAFSGGSVAVAMNIYDRLIYTVNEILRLLKYVIVPNDETVKKYIENDNQKLDEISKKNIFQRFAFVFNIGIKNFGNFIIPLAIGGVLSILILAKFLNFAMEKNPYLLTAVFLGLMIGTIPGMFKEAKNSTDCKIDNKINNQKITKQKVKNNKIKNEEKIKNKIINAVIFLIIAIAVATLSLLEKNIEANEIAYTFSNNLKDILTMLTTGAVIAFSLIVPGVSGTLILMMMGRYKAVIEIINKLDIFKMLMCGLGAILGAIPLFYLMEKFLKNYRQKTYYGVLGFVVGSIIKIFVEIFININKANANFGNIKAIIIISLSAVIGYFLIKFAEKINFKASEKHIEKDKEK